MPRYWVRSGSAWSMSPWMACCSFFAASELPSAPVRVPFSSPSQLSFWALSFALVLSRSLFHSLLEVLPVLAGLDHQDDRFVVVVVELGQAAHVLLRSVPPGP